MKNTQFLFIKSKELFIRFPKTLSPYYPKMINRSIASLPQNAGKYGY